MPLSKLQPSPGITREGTTYAAEGKYYSGDKVRFRSGFPEKIGGWIRMTANQFVGTARALINWISLSGDNYLGVGTSKKYYKELGTAFTDITPLRLTTTGEATFAATNGSTTVVVTDNAHGALDGDYVTFSSALTLGGAITATVLNREYVITWISVNAYSITTSVAATAGDSGNGGAGVVAAYQISVGLDVYIPGVGWGSGPWGISPWGMSATQTVGSQLRLWSHDIFGEDLIYAVRNGGVYYYDVSTEGTAGRGVTLDSLTGSQAPTQVGLILVSQKDRHVIALGSNNLGGSGAFDPLQIRWSDTESAGEWEPLVTNAAGDFRLSVGSDIITGLQTKQEILVWTDSALYSMQYIGAPFTFGVNMIGSNQSIMGPNAASIAGNTAYWMGQDKFYKYSGSVETLPCTLRQYVFNDLNKQQAYQCFSGTVEAFNEVWWFYPSSGSESIDRYVIYNYVENLWYYGTMARTAWLDSRTRDYPLAADYNNRILYHENGVDDVAGESAVAITSYIESSDFDIADGDSYSFVRRMLPDLNFIGSTIAAPSCEITLYPRGGSGASYKAETGQTVTASAISPTQLYTNQVYVRVRGRQMKFRIGSSNLGTQWQLGATRLDIRPDGRKQ